MKKLLLILALFPFLTFGLTSLDVVPNSIRVYTFDYVTSLNDYSTSFESFNSFFDDPFSVYSSTPFGLVFNSVHQISLPNQNYFSSTNSSFDINFPVRCNFTNSNSRVFVSPFLWTSCQRLFSLCVNLYLSGYRGPGAVSVNTKPSPLAVNFNFPVLVADVLSSTNTVYRQILLSSLNSISSGVASIDSGLSSLSPQVSSILDVNQNIYTNTSMINDSIQIAIDELEEINQNTQILAKSSDITNAANVVSSAAASAAADIVDSLIGDYDEAPTRGSKAYSSRTSIKSQMKDWRSDLKTQLNDWKAEAKTQLNDWKADLKRDLQAWKTSDETGILNIRNDLDSIRGTAADIVGSSYSIDSHLSDYFVDSTNPDNPFYRSSSILTNGVRDSVREASSTLSNEISNASVYAAGIITNGLQNSIDDLKNKFFNGNDWINVRVMYPLHGQDQEAVNVHLDGWDNYEFIDHELLSGTLKSTFEGIDLNMNLEPWLSRWDHWTGDNEYTFVDQYNLLTNLVLYYDQYNQVFSNFNLDHFDTFNFASTNTLDRLRELGADPRTFWHFQVGATLLQSDFYSLMFDFNEILEDALSSIVDPKTGEPLTLRSALNIMKDSLPSATQLISDVGNFTNSYNVTYIHQMSNFLASASSSFKTQISSVYQDSGLPSTVYLFNFAGHSWHIDTTPLSSAFSILRTGLAFGYSLLLIFFLPKFVLFWLNRYSNLFLLALNVSRYRKH